MQKISLRSTWRSALICVLLAGLLGSRPAAPVRAQQRLCPLPFEAVSLPLPELGNRTYVRMDGQQTEFTGGLYPGGSNTRPPAHEAAGLAAAARIRPLNQSGSPDPGNGRIVMISVGMSNVNMEFSEFIKTAKADPDLNPQLVLVNGAQNGQVSPMWVDPHAPTWDYVDRRLKDAGVTPRQVQAAWVKQTRTGGGNFPILAQAVQADLESIARNLKLHYPNLQIAYFSSRTNSYTYFRGLSPDPQAFETGFSVKWMIEKQINGAAELNFDPASGEVQAPYLSWGPYLWIDGMNPRADGMQWTGEDLVIDCTHPSNSGVAKVVDMLMQFFKSDTTAVSWFLADPAKALAPSPTAPLPPAPQPSATLNPAPTLVARTQGAPTLGAPTSISSPTVTPRPVLAATQANVQSAPPSTGGSNLPLAAAGVVAALGIAAVIFWRSRRA